MEDSGKLAMRWMLQFLDLATRVPFYLSSLLIEAVKSRPGMEANKLSKLINEGTADGIITSSYYVAKDIERQLSENGIQAKAFDVNGYGAVYVSHEDSERAHNIVDRYYKHIELGGLTSMENVYQCGNGNAVKITAGAEEIELLTSRLSRVGVLYSIETNRSADACTIAFPESDISKVEQVRASVKADLLNPEKADIYAKQFAWRNIYINGLKGALMTGLNKEGNPIKSGVCFVNERGESITFGKKGFMYIQKNTPCFISDDNETMLEAAKKSFSLDEDIKDDIFNGINPNGGLLEEGDTFKDKHGRELTRVDGGFEFTDVGYEGFCKYGDEAAINAHLINMIEEARNAESFAPIILRSKEELAEFEGLSHDEKLKVMFAQHHEYGRPELTREDLDVIGKQKDMNKNVFIHIKPEGYDDIITKEFFASEIAEQFGLTREEADAVANDYFVKTPLNEEEKEKIIEVFGDEDRVDISEIEFENLRLLVFEGEIDEDKLRRMQELLPDITDVEGYDPLSDEAFYESSGHQGPN